MNDLLRLCQSGLYDTDKFYEGSYNHPKTQDKSIEPPGCGPNRHTYVDAVYGNIFKRLKDSAKNILEIGAFTGGSHLLWRDYFENAKIIALDIDDCPALHDQERIEFIQTDAYNINTLYNYPNDHFDIIIDDGPHTYASMEYTIKHYSKKLKKNGILVVEDIPNDTWVPNLIKNIPQQLQQYVTVYDLRTRIGRYDDILLVIDCIDV